ncbi:MAG TPA: DUF1810 domain-containing protein [Allosphingosinicella sp.]
MSEGLERFIAAQAAVYVDALRELREGRKRSHWMWFIFPQLRGLGASAMSVRYGIESRQEAAAYRAHPILGPRLYECTEAVNAAAGRSAERIFGQVDAMKLRSSMTLFDLAGGGAPFRRCLDTFFDGEPDRRTLELIEGRG